VTAPAGSWLHVADVKSWLRLTDTVDDALLDDVCGSVQPWVERCRPEWWLPVEPPADPPVDAYQPDTETYQGAVMLASRLYRRRNSVGGIESFAESVTYVARWDPDVARFLRTGDYTMPAVG
jgi:hypothetical protein